MDSWLIFPIIILIMIILLCWCNCVPRRFVLIVGYLLSFYQNYCLPCIACTGQLIQSVFGHHSTILCLDYDQVKGLCSHNEGGLVASGSCDCTIMLWKWSGQKCRIISSTLESTKGDSVAVII